LRQQVPARTYKDSAHSHYQACEVSTFINENDYLDNNEQISGVKESYSTIMEKKRSVSQGLGPVSNPKEESTQQPFGTRPSYSNTSQNLPIEIPSFAKFSPSLTTTLTPFKETSHNL